jgi:hypothetical protein
VPTIPSDAAKKTNIPASKGDDACTEQAKREQWRFRIEAAATIIGVIVAVIYGCQLYEMRKATKIAAENYLLQTKALHIDQRAWVAPDIFDGSPKLNEKYIVRVVLKNTGKTFAYDCRTVIDVRTKKAVEPDPDFERLLQQKRETPGGLLAPNQIRPCPILMDPGKTVSQDVLDMMNNQDWIVLVFGKITYRDVFGCSHWTTFCTRVHKDGFEAHDAYNDADRNVCP